MLGSEFDARLKGSQVMANDGPFGDFLALGSEPHMAVARNGHEAIFRKSLQGKGHGRSSHRKPLREGGRNDGLAFGGGFC